MLQYVARVMYFRSIDKAIQGCDPSDGRLLDILRCIMHVGSSACHVNVSGGRSAEVGEVPRLIRLRLNSIIVQ